MNICPARLASALIMGMAANALSAESVDWRMAASARKKDFAHIVIDSLSAATETAPKSLIRNIADAILDAINNKDK